MLTSTPRQDPSRPTHGSGAAAMAAVGAGSASGAVERMARLAGALLRAPLVRVYLCDGEQGSLRCCFGEAWEIPAADLLACEARDREEMAELTSDLDLEWRSGLAAPLRSGEGVRGVLEVLSPDERSWSDEERAWLEDVAAGAAAELELRSEPWSRPERAPPPSPGPRREIPRGRGDAEEASVPERLRGYITGSMHRCQLRPGDRLPSIRSTAAAFGVTPYSALQAYAVLESEGLVERRERSGIFVSQLELRAGRALPETGVWLAEVLTQACAHQLKVPALPDLIRRWTTTAPIRCLCVESCADFRVSLCGELRRQFGVEAVAITLEELLRSWDLAAGSRGARVSDADLLVTTSYHAADVRRVAIRLEMPLLIATVNPQIVRAAEEWLARQPLTVICADPLFGERMQVLHGEEGSGRMRVVLADDTRGLDSLDRAEPVLLTPAARQRMRRPDFRLIAPLSPAFSLEFAGKVSEMLVRLHIEAERA